MVLIIVIAVIAAVVYFAVRGAVKGNSQNTKVDQAPQPVIVEQNDSRHKKTSIEEMAAARERHIQARKVSVNNKPEPKEIAFPPTEIGYEYSEMVGMYNIGITENDYGIFDGYAIAEANNSYDKFAVGIHRSKDRKLVGYIPRDFRGKSNEVVHREISSIGGMAEAVIKITGSTQRSYGSVYIKTN